MALTLLLPPRLFAPVAVAVALALFWALVVAVAVALAVALAVAVAVAVSVAVALAVGGRLHLGHNCPQCNPLWPHSATCCEITNKREH